MTSSYLLCQCCSEELPSFHWGHGQALPKADPSLISEQFPPFSLNVKFQIAINVFGNKTDVKTERGTARPENAKSYLRLIQVVVW